jgi:putative toxin-antitoxin system antitoxin component (TIGR02293 family)
MAGITAKKFNEYFEDWLGIPAKSDQDIFRLVDQGLPLKSIGRLIRGGLSKNEVFSLVVNAKKFQQRRSRSERLSKPESDRAVRVARILTRAQLVMGDTPSALKWLRRPRKRFSGRSSFEMLSTEPGGRLVEEMLIQIDEGMFA